MVMETVNFEIYEEKNKTNFYEITVCEFTEIYKTYYKRVFKYICYRIDDQHMAEDLCSQVFEKIIEKYSSFSRNNMTFEGWIFAIARNTITDYHRKNKRRGFHF